MTTLQRFAAALLAALSVGAAAQTVALSPSVPVETPFGAPFRLTATINGPCNGATEVVLRDQLNQVLGRIPIVCSGGSFNNVVAVFDNGATHFLPIGAHFLVAEVGAAKSNLATITVSPTDRLVGSGIPIGVGLSSSPLLSVCDRRVARQLRRELSPLPAPPPQLRTPTEVTHISSTGCGAPGAAGFHQQAFSMTMPGGFPDNVEVWVYDTFFGTSRGKWSRVAIACRDGGTNGQCPPTLPVVTHYATIQGSTITFTLTGDEVAINAAVVVAVPQRDASNDRLQDQWWMGPGENGWGLNVAKNGTRLFVTLYAYDSLGRPLWVVVPAGRWDPVTGVWWGEAYIPKGSSYTNYEYLFFEPGTSVGTISLSFDPATGDEGHLDYDIDGVAGGKQIFRYVFGNRAAAAPFGGMWWAGSRQDGWGVAIQQQGDTVFVTWYTYLGDRRTFWFVTPDGRRTGSSTFSGTVYSTTGAEWIGIPTYPGDQTRVKAVGTMELVFTDADHATMTTVVDGLRQVHALERFGF